MGGSQGAQIFSNIIPKLLLMIPENLKKQIFIIQQVREEDKTKLILEYKKIKIDFILKTFLMTCKIKFIIRHCFCTLWIVNAC